jgi:hypothetical protein
VKHDVAPAQASDVTRTLFQRLLKEEAGSDISLDVDLAISRLKREYSWLSSIRRGVVIPWRSFLTFTGN